MIAQQKQQLQQQSPETAIVLLSPSASLDVSPLYSLTHAAATTSARVRRRRRRQQQQNLKQQQQQHQRHSFTYSYLKVNESEKERSLVLSLFLRRVYGWCAIDHTIFSRAINVSVAVKCNATTRRRLTLQSMLLSLSLTVPVCQASFIADIAARPCLSLPDLRSLSVRVSLTDCMQ